jgi:diguanylate cyclase (GGDEF)-like protein
MSNPHEIMIDELRDLEILRHAAPESIEGILDSCTVMILKKNDVLLKFNQLNSKLYLILSGQMSVHLSAEGSKPAAILPKGEIVGEISLIDRQGASALVVADSDCRLLVMEEHLLWSLVQVSHAAACNLLCILARRLRSTNTIAATGIKLDMELHRYGTVDVLTGLHNRYWLNEILPRHLVRSRREGAALSVLMIDIDHFKDFNDRHGHLCGDRGIHLVGRILLENLRPTEAAGRFGGDEFVVLLPGLDIEKARITAERLRKKTMTTELKIADDTTLPPLTISIGIAQAQPGDSPDDLLASADAALYRAKGKGRNSVSA